MLPGLAMWLCSPLIFCYSLCHVCDAACCQSLLQNSFKCKILLSQDLSNYNKNAVAIAKKYFNVPDIDDYYKKTDPKPLIFCHFARGLGDKVYNEVTEFKALYKTLMEVIVDPLWLE